MFLAKRGGERSGEVGCSPRLDNVQSMGSWEAITTFVRRLPPDQRRILAISQVYLVISVSLELLIPQQIQRIIDDGIRNEDVSAIVSTSLLMLVFSFGSALFGIAASRLTSSMSTEAAHQLRMAGYERVTGLSFGDLDRFNTGALLVRLTSDVSVVRSGSIIGAAMLIRAPVMLIGAVGLIAFQTPQLLLPTIAVIAIMSMIIVSIVPKLSPLYRAQQQRLDGLNTVLQENLAGVQVVKNFVRQPLELERYESRNDDLYDAALRPARRIAIMEPSFMTLLFLAVSGALLLTGSGGTDFLTAGELATFFNYLFAAMLPIAFLGFVLPEIGRMAGSLGRLMEVIEAEPEVADPDNPTPLDEVAGRIEFENVSLCYRVGDDEKSPPVLDDVSFVIEPGETVVILGATGSGKTSLISCIPRFYDVTNGAVRIDGHDVRDLALDDLRSNVAVALQQANVFTGSIARNISMGRSGATSGEIAAAAESADASSFISALDDGFDANATERGNNLSGGQRQRIALARALVAESQVVILDDTTSAVDVATEARIMTNLEDRFGDTTVLMVVQRVTAALSADRILLLDHGRLIGNGSHAELPETSERYREIVESQLGPLDEIESLLAQGSTQ